MTAATRFGGSATKASLWLVACGLWAAGAAGAFSHREALKKPGAKCADCHASTAASVTSSGKRNVRFNHKLHLSMGNVAPVIATAIDSGKYLGAGRGIRPYLNTKNGCAACHRGLEQSDRAAKSNLPEMADCLVCHSQIEPPFSCEKCHINTSSLKPATHTRDFIDVHSSKKAQFDKASCRVCHGVSFRCMGCH